MIALNSPAPGIAPPPGTASMAPPAAPPPPAEGDLASYIEARRRARGEPAQAPAPVEDEKARHNRAVAANLGLQSTPGLGRERVQGGGMFQIERIGVDDAEFAFFGWHSDMRRNLVQHFEVRRGENGDTRIAVVRKMIEIIRQHESGDFVWESRRQHRSVTLSARQKDNAELEAYLLREFFEDPRLAR